MQSRKCWTKFRFINTLRFFFTLDDIIPNLDWRWFMNGISDAYPYILSFFLDLIHFVRFCPLAKQSSSSIATCIELDIPCSTSWSSVQSSAYLVVSTTKSSGIESSRSFMCILKSAGESTNPCGTSQGQLAIVETVPFRFTC